jgi:benzoylsuccinyl-CoA thiolase BbsA subunit
MAPQATDIVQRPIWDGLMGEDKEGPYLVGGRCSHCRFLTLGPRDPCPNCWTSNTMQPFPIGRTGTLYSYTVIHQVPTGYKEPFAAGYIDTEDSVRVFAHVENTPESLRIGGRLHLQIAPLRQDERGIWLSGPRYKAINRGSGG